ncbi:MAG TPA: hypothetical protein VGC77_14210 [Rhodopseudomonas sp.]|uniref:hypothetical protein n=1 Tax=Rhodopseudomonas sp. TaxID=1078 RepID=UPI002EDBB2EB
MSKFGNLVADVSKPLRVELIDPATEEVIRDRDGKAAFISVFASDSDRGREFDKSDRKKLNLRVKQSRNGIVEPDDQLEKNIAKCAFLTESWYLVDRVTLEPIDVPCTVENAVDLYSPPGLTWLFVQPWAEANKTANFLPKPAKNSAPTPSGDSAATES